MRRARDLWGLQSVREKEERAGRDEASLWNTMQGWPLWKKGRKEGWLGRTSDCSTLLRKSWSGSYAVLKLNSPVGGWQSHSSRSRQDSVEPGCCLEQTQGKRGLDVGTEVDWEHSSCHHQSILLPECHGHYSWDIRKNTGFGIRNPTFASQVCPPLTLHLH